jgi:RNA polymerase sigma factor
VEHVLPVHFKRFIGKRKRRESHDEAAVQIEEHILLAQQGDEELRNQFITDYQPFIAKITSRFCRRYIDPSRDDEYSIAMHAFNEAIDKYSHDSGRSFLGFAETVIRRRLIDYVRKEQRFTQQIPYSSFDVEDDENQVVNPVEIHQALRQHEADLEAEARKQEIAELSAELGSFGVAFSDLVEVSPKHSDSRKLLIQVAYKLAESDEMMVLLREKDQLPIKQLLTQVEVSRKTLERNRKYVIAIALVVSGNYPYIQDYLDRGIASQERSGTHG